MLSDALKLPTFTENDGNAAAIAELLFGHGHGESDFLYIFVGPALGGGAVLRGEPLLGARGNAADLGVLPVPQGSPARPAASGAQATILLARASLNVLARELRGSGFEVASVDDLQRACDAALPAFQVWQEDCVAALSHAIRAACAVLDVPVCIIDSDIRGSFVPGLIRALEQVLGEVPQEWRVAPRLLAGSFGPDASALGAASLPMFFNFAPHSAVLRGEQARGPPRF